MKKLVLFIGVLVATTIGLGAQTQATAAQEKNSSNKETAGPKAEWNTLVVDLGNVVRMTKTDAEFLLTNTGDQPLIITNARASCGCTNLRYSREPIPPGETVAVQVTFNGSGSGSTRKTITVYTNDPKTATTILAFTANVVSEEKVATTP